MYRIDIGGNADGPVVAGDYNVVIDARHGSTVTLLREGERPRPVRRERVELLPRPQDVPLGRDAELALLAQTVPRGGPVQLWGPPGVGKSTLLRHAAHTLPPGPDGVLFLSAAHREVADLAHELFSACYDAAGYAPTGTESKRLMAEVAVTVYVDNVEWTAEQLREFMDAAPKATFVFASRDRSLLGEGVALEIGGLQRHAALSLLGRELGRSLGEGDQAAVKLCRAAGGRPLPLLRAAALARTDPSGAVVLPRPGAVADLVPLLLDQLDAGTTDALRLLATLRDAEVDPVHVGALTDVADPAALCRRLAELGLVESTELGFRAAPDVKPALRRRNQGPFSITRLCEHLARWATDPGTTPEQVAGHARAFEVAAELAERTGHPELAVRVTWAASPALARSLRFGAWGRLLGLGRDAARRTNDDRARAYFTHEAGVRALLTGRRVLAGVLLAEAVALWRLLGDDGGAGAAAGAQQFAPPPPPNAPVDPEPLDALPDSPPETPPDAWGDVDPGGLDGGGAGPGGDAPGPDASGWDVVDPLPPQPQPAQPQPDCVLGPDPAADPGTGSESAADAANHMVSHVPDQASGAAQAASTAPPPPMAPPPGVSEAALGGATSATAASAATGILAAVAAAAALAIGGLVVAQQSDSDEQPAAGGLAGTWQDDQGGVTEFVEAGSGTYSVTGVDLCGEAYTTEFTENGGSYRATVPIYDVTTGSCGQVIGEGAQIITLDAGGDTAELLMEAVYLDEGAECYSCGSYTLTRLSGP
ncbi:ATP-binding protein [Streptomyces sp. 8K308]|nr:ATP-binding protein [Streptomyces sp. 8K308]